MTFVNGGANVGYFSLLASGLVGDSGRVFAFEPEPHNIGLLKRSIERNAVQNVTLTEAALSDRSGKATLFLDNSNFGEPSLEASNVTNPAGSVNVNTTTLDEFLGERADPRVDVIKLDTQGAEGHMLAGAEETLSTPGLRVVMEFYPWGLRNMGSDPAAILNPSTISAIRSRCSMTRAGGCSRRATRKSLPVVWGERVGADSCSSSSSAERARRGTHRPQSGLPRAGLTGGMETYARELVPAMVEERPDLKFTAFVNREAAESNFDFAGGAIQSVTVPVRSRRRWDWVRGEQQLLPRLAARRGIDLLHSLGNTAPTWGNFRRVVTVHDLIHRIHPEAHFGLASFGMRWLVQLAIGRTDRVVVPSRNTKDDIVRLVGTSPDRIDVAPNGVRPPQVPAADPLELRSRLGLGDRPVVMTASAMRPHKNLPRLLDALALVPVEQRPILVLPGYRTQHEAELRRLASKLGIEKETLFPGWLTSGELESLFSAATMFVFPSLYEGFGLPVIEAMVRGVPVACSDRGALREVAEGAALLFDPEQPAQISDAMTKLISDPDAADRLREAGRSRAPNSPGRTRRGRRWPATSGPSRCRRLRRLMQIALVYDCLYPIRSGGRSGGTGISPSGSAASTTSPI